jgi:RNA polymerase sigma factor (sigma-70 family)
MPAAEVALEVTSRAPDLVALLETDPNLQSKLFAAANRLLRNRRDAEDAVGDVLFRVWDKGTGHVQGDLRTYLIAAVHKRALTLWRRQKRQHLEDPATFVRLRDSAASPEAVALAMAQRAAMDGAVAKLPTKQAKIVRGRAAGLSYTELSEALGISRPRVKQLADVAYARLRRLLRTWEDME